ncbi:cytochrome P450 [Backusella circina FSU 941]|nr:cytochrome P450 [Backusella circina FSU 941]
MLSSNDKAGNYQDLKDIPSPKGYPVVGHLLSLGEQPGRQVARWHDELNSPLIRLKMGVQEWIMISDPYLAHKIFVTNGVDTSSRPFNSFQSVHYSRNQKGISFGEGKDWKNGRSALLSVLSPKAVEQYIKWIEKESHNSAQRLIDATKKDGGVNPISYLKLSALNVISHVTIGKNFSSIEDPLFKDIVSLIETSMAFSGPDKNISSFLPIFTPIDILGGYDKKMQAYIEDVRDPLLKRLIDEAVVEEGPNIFKKFREEGFSLDSENQAVLLNDLIAGGTDTTSTSLAWFYAILCHYPEVQDKIFNEINDFKKKNGRLPVFIERDELPYCLCVMKEGMRIRPVSPFGLPHKASKDIVVDGYFIPKNTSLFCSMDKIHMNENVYPNAKEFIPERFMNNTKLMFAAANGKINERDHYSFGWGRRTCPGIYLAEAEMFCAFIELFSRCRVEPIKDMQGNAIYPNIEDVDDIVIVQLPMPFKVKFVERNPIDN